MQDFNEFSKSNQSSNNSGQQDIMDIVRKIAKDFDGKNQGDLIKSIYNEAKIRKAKGTLSNSEIDGFYSMLYPLLDDKQRKILSKIVNDLKNL